MKKRVNITCPYKRNMGSEVIARSMPMFNVYNLHELRT